MIPDGVCLRPGTAADWPALTHLDEIGFGRRSVPAELALWQSLIDENTIVIAVDGGAIVGKTMAVPQVVTVPGGAQLAAMGITSVAVAPTHRRRGLLRALYADQHRRFAGYPLAMLTASEGGIYRRFGYGPATQRCEIDVDRRFATMHADVPDDRGRVGLPTLDEAAALIPRIHERWQPLVPGAQVRPKAVWDNIFAERNAPGDDRPYLYSFVHPDGYALYTRRGDGDLDAVRVHELRAVTEDAYAALWRCVLDLDLVAKVEAGIPPDDPLPYLLTDARQVRTTELQDALWVRIMDVPAALTARGYAADLDIVLDVTDPFLDAGGRFALTVRGGVASCVPTDASADVGFTLDTLGSLYLGAHRATTSARAHRISGSVDAIHALDRALVTARPPVMGWGF